MDGNARWANLSELSDHKDIKKTEAQLLELCAGMKLRISGAAAKFKSNTC